MTQHIHKAIIDQLTTDTSLEVETPMRDYQDTWINCRLVDVINDMNGAKTFRIKPRPHPNDKYREAFERGEPVWVSLPRTVNWFPVTKESHATWNFNADNWQYSLTDPNPVDPYAHLRAANEEGRVAWHNNITGEWVMPAGKKWDCLDYVPPDRYKIVEPDRVSEVHHHRIYFGIGAPMIDITEQYTLSGLTGKITAKVVE